jgi:quinol monooxygenase YgiN
MLEERMSDLANIVLLRARVGKADVLGEALGELVAATREEPGCAVCELSQSSDDPNTWMVYERWRGQGAFASHMKQPYVARFLARLDDLASEPAEVRPFKHRG